MIILTKKQGNKVAKNRETIYYFVPMYVCIRKLQNLKTEHDSYILSETNNC